jgi:hypothetical protein
MLKMLIAAILLTFTGGEADAYDKKRIDKFCFAAHKKKNAKYIDCVARERKNGKLLDELAASMTLDVQRGIMNHCLKEFSESYSLAIFCVDEETKRAMGLASMLDVPSFDSVAYCKSIGKAAGGSYQIEITCRDQEALAVRAIRQAEVPHEIMIYCAKIGETVGGSFQIMVTCIDQEISAKRSLQ